MLRTAVQLWITWSKLTGLTPKKSALMGDLLGGIQHLHA